MGWQRMWAAPAGFWEERERCKVALNLREERGFVLKIIAFKVATLRTNGTWVPLRFLRVQAMASFRAELGQG